MQHEIEAVSREAINAVLAGNKLQLANCFHWNASPQGADYWLTIQQAPEGEPLPPDAVAFLQQLLDGELPEIVQ